MTSNDATRALALTLMIAGCGTATAAPGDAAAAPDGGSDAEAACTAQAQAQCTRRDTCSTNHFSVLRTYLDMNDCVQRNHDSCIAGLSASSSGNTPDNVMTCASMLASVSCDDFANDALPAPCLAQPGMLAAGAPCHFNGQCASAFCNVLSGSECGACGPSPAEGDACDGPGARSTCGPHGLVCVGATTMPYAAGVCTAAVTMATGTCDTTHPCGAGLSCTPVSLTAANRTCQVAGATVGAACGGSMNPGCDVDRGLTCNTMTHMCAPFGLVAAGMNCGAGDDGTFVHCAAGGDCVGYTVANPHGACAATAADGAACDRSAGPFCETPAACIVSGEATAGTCQLGSADSCH